MPEDRQTRLKAATGLPNAEFRVLGPTPNKTLHPVAAEPNPSLAPSAGSRPGGPCKASLPLWASSMVRRHLREAAAPACPVSVGGSYAQDLYPDGGEATTRFLLPTRRWPQSGKLPPSPRGRISWGRWSIRAVLLVQSRRRGKHGTGLSNAFDALRVPAGSGAGPGWSLRRSPCGSLGDTSNIFRDVPHFNLYYRVALGVEKTTPNAPTDPYEQISRIRFLMPQIPRVPVCCTGLAFIGHVRTFRGHRCPASGASGVSRPRSRDTRPPFPTRRLSVGSDFPAFQRYYEGPKTSCRSSPDTP